MQDHAQFTAQSPIFVVGSPRSGTTMLAAALGRHPDIAYYYEPYFIWDYVDGPGEDDVRTASDVQAAARDRIIAEFDWFLHKSGKRILVEKTPENSFRIDYINSIFPNARFIHITRRGHDAILSLNREWRKRQKLVRTRSYRSLFSVISENFVEYPFIRCWFLLIQYELKTRANLRRKHIFNKSKWQGEEGYGPRFPGWRDTYARNDLLTYNAEQWRHSVEACVDGLAKLQEDRVLTIRYEDLTSDTVEVWAKLQEFAGVSQHPELAPQVLPNRASIERKHAEPGTLEAIDRVIEPTLLRLGYTK